MASSAKTSSIALNQWAATDPVLREDFNADNLILDGILKFAGKQRTGLIDGCEDMGQSFDSIEFGFEPKLMFLWQTGVESPWYTVIPMLYGSTKAVCARPGSTETRTLSCSVSGNTVAWAPETGVSADHNRTTLYGYLAIG